MAEPSDMGVTVFVGGFGAEDVAVVYANAEVEMSHLLDGLSKGDVQ